VSEAVVTSGQDLTVTHLDRRYGGRRTTVLQIRGDDGSVVYGTDVSIVGRLTVNGRSITGGSGSGSMVNEVLGAPYQLSYPPSGDIALFVNGQLQRAADYTLSPTDSIIWKSPDFMLAPTDFVEAVYQI
jgi:hypothetical protein